MRTTSLITQRGLGVLPQKGTKGTNQNFPLLRFLCLFVALISGCTGSQTAARVDFTNDSTVGGGVSYGSTNVNVGVHGQYNTNTGAYSGGITITFSREPSAGAAGQLLAVGAVALRDGMTFQLVHVDLRDPRQRTAIETALTEGAMLSGMGN